MMERSSRFISLSGWSGVAAGVCALVGAYFAHGVIHRSSSGTPVRTYSYQSTQTFTLVDFMGSRLFTIAVFTFIAAFVSAFIFTYGRSRRNNTPIWSIRVRRLTLNVAVPMVAGGIFLLKLIENGTFGLIAPGCLIFYGLALINGSKYTLGEIKWIGYSELVLGLISCWFIGWGLYFWAIGFGLLHIIYGIAMWNKYERTV